VAGDMRQDYRNRFRRAVEVGFERYKMLGGVGIKIGVAYRRSLRFDDATQNEALAALAQIREGSGSQAVVVLGNFIVRHILQKSLEVGFPVQIHTGYQCGQLEQGNPTNLVNLIQEFPQVNFVLFHGGYPYADEAGLLAKAFPNVYLDMCWMPLLSPAMAASVLERWLNLVPHNKIMWGGDVWTVEECFGAVKLFKDVLARVLVNLMEYMGLDINAAMQIASGIGYRNACELFGIPVEKIAQ